MRNMKRSWLRGLVSATALGVLTAPALAFFPPIIAPINIPTTITKTPTPVEPVKKPPISPVKVPPVEPCVKPHPKPRPKLQDCSCSNPTGTANTPEPTTLLSAGIGIGVAGIVGWVKKRRKNAAQ